MPDPLRPTRTAYRVVLAAGGAAAALLSLVGCSASRTGYAGVAMDPAGRLLVVLALCDNQKLGALTLTDETTGTSITVKNPRTRRLGHPHRSDRQPSAGRHLRPARPEPRVHAARRYQGPGLRRRVGYLAPIRFKLDDVVKEQKLRQGSLLTANSDDGGTALTSKDTFVAGAKDSCG